MTLLCLGKDLPCFLLPSLSPGRLCLKTQVTHKGTLGRNTTYQGLVKPHMGLGWEQ